MLLDRTERTQTRQGTEPDAGGVDGVGEIVAIEGPSGHVIGDRVILYPHELCGKCRYCLSGEQPLCTSARIFGKHRDGTFAEEIVAPLVSLVALPQETNIHHAAAQGVAYLTAWRMVFGTSPTGPGHNVLVQGAGGGVSYAAMPLAQMGGARVIVSTTGPEKLMHFQQLGVGVIDHRTQDVAKAVLMLTDEEGADLVIDNIGEKP